MHRRSKLYLLPGLGGDSRLFVEQRRYFGDELVTPDFVAPRSRSESLSDYAKRWLDVLAPEPPFFLGGLSFGGMVAMEMSRHAAGLQGVFLVASCRSCDAVRDRYRMINRLGQHVPGPIMRLGVRAFAASLPLFNDLRPEHRILVYDMGRRADLGFVKWAGGAIARWSHDGRCDAPVHQIHGKRDLIIPLHQGDPDAILTTGRHLIQFSHADIVNRYLDRRMSRQDTPPPTVDRPRDRPAGVHDDLFSRAASRSADERVA